MAEITGKQFVISELLMRSLSDRGTLEGFIQSQRIVNNFDPEKPHRIVHDAPGHQYVVVQDGPVGEPEAEDEQDAEAEFQRRAERAISFGAEDDLSV